MKPLSSNQRSRFLFKAITIPLALLGAAGLSHATTTTSANLLADPGFETQTTPPSYGAVVVDFNTTKEIWGTENGVVVGSENGVLPVGTRMLRMVDDGGITTATVQFISLAAYAPEIDASNASFNMSSLFNTTADRGTPTASVIATFFATDTSWPSSIGPGIGSQLVLDTNPTTWQTISGSGNIPVGARWVGYQVAFNNASLGGLEGYVDANSEIGNFTVTTIPEPSSATLGLVAAGLLLRRKRQASR